MMKSHAMRETCCYMVLHGGRPDPVDVVDALSEVEGHRDALYEALEWAEDELASYAPDPSCRSKITDDVLARVRTALAKARGEQ